MIFSIFAIIIVVILYIFVILFSYLKKLKNNITGRIEAIYYYVSENNWFMNTHNSKNNGNNYYKLNEEWNKRNPKICHALGVIDGILFTESVESFELHYEKGSRVFEADFSLSADGEPIILHDWQHLTKKHNGNFKLFNYIKENYLIRHNKYNSLEIPMTKNEFADFKIFNKYTTITLERFMILLEKYTDVYIIVSTKSLNHEYNSEVQQIFKKLFETINKTNPIIKSRIILHAYSLPFFYSAMNEFGFVSAIYRVQNYIHPQVLAKSLQNTGLSTVTVMDYWYCSKDYLHILHQNGIKVIMCTTKSQKRTVKIRENICTDMIMSPYGEDA